MRLLAHPPHSSESKLFRVEFADLQVSEVDSVESWRYQLKCQLFEAEYLADEDSRLMPTDVSAIVHPPEKETLLVCELRQLAWQSDRAGVVQARWDLVVQALMGALIVEHVAKMIEATLLRTKGCRGRLRRVFLQRAMHPLVATVLLRSASLYSLVHDPKLHPPDREF